MPEDIALSWRGPLRRLARDWLTTGDRLLFPRACPVCGAGDPAGTLCQDCRGELLAAAGRSCARCAMPLARFAADRGGCADCRGRALGFDAALALGPYQGPVRGLCLRLKHAGNAWLAAGLMDLVLQARGPALADWLAEVQAPPGRGAVVVGVPLHWSRRWRRRYDQAEALAEVAARRLDLEWQRPLRRVRATAPLAGRGQVERARTMRRAFRLRAGAARRLAGRDVVLVDDILTTGATCGAAARALKRAGARRVLALVVARAEGKA